MGGDRLRDPRDREVRAMRILDVTADLLLRHGYRRVTIDDVARGAGIGKGTVYLHWKTRDDLFRAVLEREVLEAIEDLLGVLRQDAQAWMPHHLAGSYFVAIMGRPLLRAVFVADSELLGKLARPEPGAHETRHHLLAQAYFELLAEHGLLPGDLSTEAVAYAFQATLEGFIHAEAAVGEGQRPGIHDRADLLAFTVQRAFESGRRVSPAAEKAISAQVIALLTRVGDADRAALGIGDG
jgi:AcrR family transcriptional regulator